SFRHSIPVFDSRVRSLIGFCKPTKILEDQAGPRPVSNRHLIISSERGTGNKGKHPILILLTVSVKSRFPSVAYPAYSLYNSPDLLLATYSLIQRPTPADATH
ncbi:hypothetical protein HHX47_DHR1001066, partial [Lentinula edodes]